jgi:small subunit ribosomal protein S16
VRRREMVKIRLMRMGAKKRPFFRVVVSDARSPRDGRFIENIGKYHPLSHPSVIEIDEERALHWLRSGAQPTDPARVLLQKTGVWSRFTGEPAPPPLDVSADEPTGAQRGEPSDAQRGEASASPSGTRGVPSGDPSAIPSEEGSTERRAEETPGTREEGEETP